MGNYRKYDIVGTTILKPNFPTKFELSPYFVNTYPHRITKAYEEEFKELGISKTIKKGINSYKYHIDRELFLDRLDDSMHENPFLVSIDKDNYPSFNVPLTRNILCTIHPGFANRHIVWGDVRSVKSEGPAYRQIWKDLGKTDFHSYDHIIKTIEHLNYLEESYEEKRRKILTMKIKPNA